MARAQKPPAIALVIEVIDANDHREWTAMASEWERIMMELRNAPPALAITIYEWHLAYPVNPKPGDAFAKCPTWHRIAVLPWTLDQDPDRFRE